MQRSPETAEDLVDHLDGHCACGGSCAHCAAGGAASGLPIGPPNDVFERNADAVADSILASVPGPGPIIAALPALPALQRACACGGTHEEDGDECAECRAAGLLQRAEAGPTPAPVAPPSVHGVLGSPGGSLESSVRERLEPHFGDLSGVKIHTDARAAASAHAVGALAYTVGRNVVFGAGRYAPETPAGTRLLAHELAHVRQQTPGDCTRGPPRVLQRQPEGGSGGGPAGTTARPISRNDEIRLSRSSPGTVFFRHRPPTLRLSNLAIDAARLKKEHLAVAHELVTKILTVPPDVRILVAGHTDSSGEAERNVGLSVERAEAVRSALGPLGRTAETAAFADSLPVASNATVDGRSLNRRVEILFLPTFLKRPKQSTPQPQQDPEPTPSDAPTTPPVQAPTPTPAPQPPGTTEEKRDDDEDDDDDGGSWLPLGIGAAVGGLAVGVGGAIVSGLGGAVTAIESCVGDISNCLPKLPSWPGGDGGDDPPQEKEPEKPDKPDKPEEKKPPACGSKQLPWTIVEHTEGPQGQARHVKASPLSKCPGNTTGSIATESTYPLQFQCITDTAKGLRRTWVAMHLLHGATRRTQWAGTGETLHGPGNVRWNIIIGDQDQNREFRQTVEEGALRLVYASDPQVIWYEAEVEEYFPGNEFFAKTVRMAFGHYNVDTGTEGPTISTSRLTSTKTPPHCPPDLQKKPRKPKPKPAPKPTPAPAGPTPTPAPTPTAPPQPATSSTTARSIFASTVGICHNVLESRTFTLSRTGLLVVLNTNWEGTTAEGACEQPDFYVTLEQPGLLSNSEVASATLSPGGHNGVAWTGLDPGDYFLTIEVDDHDPACCLTGSIVVSEFAGMSQ